MTTRQTERQYYFYMYHITHIYVYITYMRVYIPRDRHTALIGCSHTERNREAEFQRDRKTGTESVRDTQWARERASERASERERERERKRDEKRQRGHFGWAMLRWMAPVPNERLALSRPYLLPSPIRALSAGLHRCRHHYPTSPVFTPPPPPPVHKVIDPLVDHALSVIKRPISNVPSPSPSSFRMLRRTVFGASSLSF